MRIVQLTPGTGNFHCGSCLRDAAMVSELRRLGHDVVMVPLYLPPVVDGPDPSDGVPIFFGGINVYLQNKSALFRHTPAWFDRLLDKPGLLRKAADRAGMTAARDLGELTLSMLAGEEGKQNKELSKLIEFLRSEARPDVVCLSNAILIGLARRIKRELGSRIVCTLAGEDGFLDTLIEPYRGRAWALLRERAADVEAFIAVSRYYGDLMSQRMALPPGAVRVVPNGIDTSGFGPWQSPPVPTVGYMARLHPAKGLGTLIDAFIRLRQLGRVPEARLHIAGAMTPADEAYAAQQRARVEQAGLARYVQWETNIDAARKSNFLASLSVLSVPATYGEAFGLYVLEAWASGVPVVQPRHAAFPELLEHTGGGILCDPDDPKALAEALETVLLEPARAQAMGDSGRRATVEYYNVQRMTREIVEVFESPKSIPQSAIRNPQSALTMAYEFTTRRTVEFADTDTAGIVHFARFFNYMESAEHEFFRSLGLSIFTKIDGQTFTFPRVHAECEYHSPLRFEDVVEVHVIVREVRHKAIVFGFSCTRHDAEGPTHIAHGSITTVCVTKADGKMKAAAIPRKVLDKIQAAPAELLKRHPAQTAKRNG